MGKKIHTHYKGSETLMEEVGSLSETTTLLLLHRCHQNPTIPNLILVSLVLQKTLLPLLHHPCPLEMNSQHAQGLNPWISLQLPLPPWTPSVGEETTKSAKENFMNKNAYWRDDDEKKKKIPDAHLLINIEIGFFKMIIRHRTCNPQTS